MSETIIGVAVRNGIVVHSLPAPNRHGNVLRLMHEGGIKIEHATHEQGFATSKRHFVSREEALPIAQAAGQMKPRLHGQYDGPKLFSEDLW